MANNVQCRIWNTVADLMETKALAGDGGGPRERRMEFVEFARCVAQAYSDVQDQMATAKDAAAGREPSAVVTRAAMPKGMRFFVHFNDPTGRKHVLAMNSEQHANDFAQKYPGAKVTDSPHG